MPTTPSTGLPLKTSIPALIQRFSPFLFGRTRRRPPWSNWVFHGPETVVEIDLKFFAETFLQIYGALKVSSDADLRQISVFGGEVMLKEVERSLGSAAPLPACHEEEAIVKV